jgi:hypothetical protein
MLNIISKSYVEGEINGPQKVVTNLIKGLDILGYPYCINKDFQTTSQLWIHDDPTAVLEVSKLRIRAIVGPNIYILPKNIPKEIDMSRMIYIQPSKWICDLWKDFGFNRCMLDVWPSAIDINEFSSRPKPVNGNVLIYYKQRPIAELDFIKNVLKRKNILYDVIYYGAYNQKDYVDKLKKARYIIWLGRHETQGIALEEALAMNVPALVWDVTKVGHWLPRTKDRDIYSPEEAAYTNTTSAEYFDERCGIKTKIQTEIEDAINKMENNWQLFSPRTYIEENLGLEKQAWEMIKLFTKHFDISYDYGKEEKIKNNGKWRNDRLIFRTFIFFRKIAKRIIGKKG